MIKKDIFFITLILILLCGYLFFRLEKSNKAIVNQLMLLKGFDNRKNNNKNNPYIDIAVKNTIRKHAGEIQTCYNQFISRVSLIQNKSKQKNILNQSGKLELDWQIDEDGEVINPEAIYSEIKDKKFVTCTIERIAQWIFPQPPYGNFQVFFII